MYTDIIIATAVTVQAIFTVVLVLVYIRRQTEIMKNQNRISSRQFEWNRAMLLNEQYTEIKSELENARANIQNKCDMFYAEEHSQQEIEQFEAEQRDLRLALLQSEIGFIGIRKYLESQGADYGVSIIQKHHDDPDFCRGIFEEIKAMGYSEDLFRLAWELNLQDFLDNDVA